MLTPHAYPVALAPCSHYGAQEVEEKVRLVLGQSGILGEAASAKPPLFTRGMHVLVKPNLLRAHALSCTHAQVVRAVCLCLQEQGIRITVADSPGFGSAQAVAKAIGLEEALQPLGLRVQEFSQVQSLSLQVEGQELSQAGKHLGTWGIAREALESDAILSVPRCKAHGQMAMTLGVKNIFGCICGLRKALAHAVQGRSLEEFCQSILALYKALPPTAALMDGITAMHMTGPSGGKPYDLHCLAASPSAMALDTAVYDLLGMEPRQIPLWHYAQELALPAAFTQNIHHVGAQPPQIYPSNEQTPFLLPKALMHVSFQPHRLLISFAKRLWSRVF